MSTRTLITGASDSGKSYYAMTRARELARAGYYNIVYSPIRGDWDGEYCERHTELVPFMRRLEQLITAIEDIKSKSPEAVVPVAVWVDEADEVLSISDRGNYWLLKKGRHYFPQIFVITQRPKMVAPTARGQCNELVAFTLKSEDASELGKDFVCDLSELPDLRKGEYVHARWLGRNRKVDKVDGFT